MNWKKIIGWTAVGILSLILLVVIVGLVVLGIAVSGKAGQVGEFFANLIVG